MLGEEGNLGLISRAVQLLFAQKKEMEESSLGKIKVTILVELLEVYNEKIRDLLSKEKNQNLAMASNDVVGNRVVATSTVEEVMTYLTLAQTRRCVKATASNSESSRSHMVFTLQFNATTTDGDEVHERNGKLNICDLAGSERLNKSGAHMIGVRDRLSLLYLLMKPTRIPRANRCLSRLLNFQGALLDETKSINKSLSTLSSVVEKLQEGASPVPYRESKLTMLLEKSLSGKDAKTLAIACCNPLSTHFNESLSTLRFAEKVNRVELKGICKFQA
jgi:Kinesin motor domain